MKNIAENSDVFEAYARIDFCYYGLREIQAWAEKPITPLEMMIDAATGYNPNEQSIKAAIELYEEIISSKRLIEADYSQDEQAVIQIKKLLKV